MGERSLGKDLLKIVIINQTPVSIAFGIYVRFLKSPCSSFKLTEDKVLCLEFPGPVCLDS